VTPSSTLSSVSDFAPGRFRYFSSVTPDGLAYLNDSGNTLPAKCLGEENDSFGPGWYFAPMAKPQHDWYLADWLRHLGKKPADIVNDLDWNKARESLMRRGEQPYTRDAINEIAAYLHLEPFELLLPPERAMALRQYRASAEQIVTLASEQPANVESLGMAAARKRAAQKGAGRKTGTNG
jgi:hypothetical protein